MKMIRAIHLLLLAVSFTSTITKADQALDGLKDSFTGLMQSSEKEFNKAAQMKTTPFALGAEISKDECLSMEKRIAANYKVNPFEFTFESGYSVNRMCGGEWGWLKNYVLNQAGTTNMGLPYAMIIQRVGESNVYSQIYRDPISNYFVDSSFRVVEVQSLSLSKGTHEVLEYGITSVDTSGNIYSSVFVKNYSRSAEPYNHAREVIGTYTEENVIPADGSVPGILLKISVKNSSDPSKDYQMLRFERADQRDWQDYLSSVLMLGSFYKYDGKYYSHDDKPNYKSSLTIKIRGGKEYCAYGSVKTDQSTTHYPQDRKAYENCLNY